MIQTEIPLYRMMHVCVCICVGTRFSFGSFCFWLLLLLVDVLFLIDFFSFHALSFSSAHLFFLSGNRSCCCICISAFWCSKSYHFKCMGCKLYEFMSQHIIQKQMEWNFFVIQFDLRIIYSIYLAQIKLNFSLIYFANLA